MAAVKLRHGRSRVQGLASLPLLATNVRCAPNNGNADKTTLTARTRALFQRMAPPSVKEEPITTPRQALLAAVIAPTVSLAFPSTILSPAEWVVPLRSV